MKLRVLLIVELENDSAHADERVEEHLEELLKEYFHDIDDIEVSRVNVESL